MIRIGDFARLACVSVRALRHYETKGLLRPGHVDTKSRYRYYDLQQLATLERLLLLKALGLPLHAIRDLLGATEPNAASITYSGPYLPPEDLYRRMCKWVGLQRLTLARRGSNT